MMKSISNLAWSNKNLDNKIALLLLKHGFKGVDIAPSIYWENTFVVSSAEIKRVKDFWKNYGIKIAAVQSLLYGHPNLIIFQDAETREKTLKHLKNMIILTAKLGATALIFGSPKNRTVGGMNKNEADSIALEFFGKLGDFAHKNGVIFCIEPNPKEYGCDFINTHEEAIRMVKKVRSPGLAINIDTSTITLNKEPIQATISKSLSYAGYMHISEPYLLPIGSGGLDNKKIATAIRKAKHVGWISFEMKKIADLRIFEKTLRKISDIYE